MRCKVGDKCFVVSSKCEANLGAIVTIVEPSQYPEKWDWWVRSEGRELIGSFHGIAMAGPFVQARDWQLLPIRPSADLATTRTTEEVTV